MSAGSLINLLQLKVCIQTSDPQIATNMRPRCFLTHFLIILTSISILCSTSFSSNFFQEKKGGEQDGEALLALREEFVDGGIPPADSVLKWWNTSLHFCQWQGVKCGKRNTRVTAIDVAGQKLDGIVSPSIGNLTFLTEIYLSDNMLHGQIPKQIGQLRRLQYVHMDGNSLEGQIPTELSNCSNLVHLVISLNKLTGQIPFQLGTLLKITWFSVSRNNLAGEMPSFFKNYSSLSELALGYNHFSGEIRDSLQGLLKLNTLALTSNNLSGSISPLYNLSSLQKLGIAMNSFSGTLVQDLDIVLPQLSILSLTDNYFSGMIPSSITNISGLTAIQISNNKLTGRVPDNLGNLKSLTRLHLSGNQLGSGKPNDLYFIDSLTNCTELKWLVLYANRLGGTLPNSIANFSLQLQNVIMNHNYITGPLPESIGELSGLSWVDFNSNLLTGNIPKTVGKLSNISRLYLDGNNLHGEIPSSLGNLTNLYDLNLSTNSLQGIIPASLGNCNGMEVFDISNNLLHGNLPNDVFSQFADLRGCFLSRNTFKGEFPNVFGKLRVMVDLDASYNNFSGELPSQLGESTSLEYLIMAGNFFEGSIPPSLGSLKDLKWLDLSNNTLSGSVPSELTLITGLQYLNLSFNQLEGEFPLFENLTEVSVFGNSRLCSSNPKLLFRRCSDRSTGQSLSRKVVIAITLGTTSSVSLIVLLFIFFCRRRQHKKDNNIDSSAEGYQRVTYAQLFKATEGFTNTNLIGTGSFGDVYRGILDVGTESKPVAVKVLNLSNHGATKSFTSECKVLRRIRHRNLLRIITSCSSLDHKGNEFKALVFSFMSNGNLNEWLHFSDMQHQQTKVLTLVKRMEIAIDVGCALDYLHNSCDPPIVHCDLKPANILLDEDMIAHVGDFGLAKLLHGVTENVNGGESLSTAIKGSIGYVAPEYGLGATISTQGDIYSYGILLLELITGKRPTADMFNNDISLRNFAERALPDRVYEVVDQCLVNELHAAIAIHMNPEQLKLQYQTLLRSFVEIGISCSAESPKERMEIQSAIKCLKGVKEKCDSIIV